MNKRNGIDEYSIFLVWLAIAFSIVAMIFKSDIFKIISLAVVIYALFRVLSRNAYKRAYENRMFKE